MTPDERAAAIVAAIAAGAGLSNGSTVWKGPNTNAPPAPSALLTLGGDIGIGLDYLVESTDLRRPRGQEVKLSTGGVREVMLDVEIFTATAIPGGGAATAEGIANRLASSLLLPSIRHPLVRSGFTPVDIGAVQSVPELLRIGFRGRALLTIRATMPALVVADFVGYIAGFTGKATVGGQDATPQGLRFQVPPRT